MKILVIEDTERHYQDAREFFSDLLESGAIEDPDSSGFIFVKDLQSAMRYLGGEVSSHDPKSVEYPDDIVDGVISDIELPFSCFYPNPLQMGVGVMTICQARKIPCVLCTAGNHHGQTHQWICVLGRALGWPEIIDQNVGDSRSSDEAETKNWERAWHALREEMAKMKNG